MEMVVGCAGDCLFGCSVFEHRLCDYFLRIELSSGLWRPPPSPESPPRDCLSHRSALRQSSTLDTILSSSYKNCETCKINFRIIFQNFDTPVSRACIIDETFEGKGEDNTARDKPKA